MRIATMTTHFRDRRESKDIIGYRESIRRCHQAGFRVLDLNMCAMIRSNTELNGDDWQREAEKIRNEADRLGMEFVQSHPPYRPFPGLHFPTEEEDKRFDMLTERAIYASHVAGAGWAVFHPLTESISAELDLDADIALNHTAFDRAVEYAGKLGVGIVFENMCDKNNKRRFGATAEELIALLDSYKGAKVGVCWDTGHANRVYTNQVQAIRKLGKRIKATHIDDNIGGDDLHMLPFMGTIDWEGLMKAFSECGYEGDLVFEVKLNDRMPDGLKDLSARYSYELGRYLLSLG